MILTLLLFGCLNGELGIDLSGDTPVFLLNNVVGANTLYVDNCSNEEDLNSTNDGFVWSISGDDLDSYTEIVYSITPEGITEDIVAVELVNGSTYWVGIERTKQRFSGRTLSQKEEGWDIYWTMGETESTAGTGGCPE